MKNQKQLSGEIKIVFMNYKFHSEILNVLCDPRTTQNKVNKPIKYQPKLFRPKNFFSEKKAENVRSQG